MVNPREIQYWNHKLEKLEHKQKDKIRKFLYLRRIKKVTDNYYHCLPIEGYNTRTYDIKREAFGDWHCNCQGYNKKGDCSHVQAVLLYAYEENPKQAKLFRRQYD